MCFKYKENSLDLSIDKPAREYFQQYLKECQNEIQNGEFHFIIRYCRWSFRSDLVKIFLTSGFFNIFGNAILNGSFVESDILEFTVPKEIQIIENGAFDMSDLSKISFEEDCELSLIQNNAFSDTKIEKFICPDGLTHLDSEVFKDCTSLNKFTLNNNIQSIGRSCFSGCANLKELHFDGTIDEFETVDLDDLWLDNSEIKQIICHDGEIALTW